MTRRFLTRGRSRWGLLLTALFLGLLLIGFATEGWRQARTIAGTVTLGQAEQLVQELGQRSRERSGPPDQEMLEQFLEAHSDVGLRYVGFFGREGEVVAQVGEPLSPPVRSSAGPAAQSLQWIGDRVRVIRRPPGPPLPAQPREELFMPPDGPPARARPPRQGRPTRPDLEMPPGPPEGLQPRGAFRPPPGPRLRAPLEEAPAPGPRPPEGPEPGRAPRGDGNGALLVLELEPLMVHSIQQRATSMLVLGSVAALGLMLSALFFWRQSVRSEELERTFEAQRRLAALGEMSAVLAHEIKNPLAALKGHAQLLEEGLEPGSRSRRKATRVVQETIRLENLVLQLLDFVRSGRVHREPVDVGSLAREAAETVDLERIELRIPEDLPAVSLDRGRMLQVLTNLLRNALQASPADGRVELALSSSAAELRIDVLDRGDGIPAGEEETIFEPFRTHRVQGVGLGLAVAKRIVELHGGRIRATNRDGGGAAFQITLPSA